MCYLDEKEDEAEEDEVHQGGGQPNYTNDDEPVCYPAEEEDYAEEDDAEEDEAHQDCGQSTFFDDARENADGFSYVERASAYLANEQYDDAIADYELIKHDPRSADFLSRRAYACSSKGDYDRAIADYDEAIRLNPNSSQLFKNHANCIISANDAQWLTEKILGSDIYAGRSEVQRQRALADLEEAIRLDPSAADCFDARGRFYANIDQYDRAIADYSEAIRLDPKDADFFADRAGAYEQNGKYELAIADYGEAIKLDPTRDDFLGRRASAYSSKSDYERAIADYDEAIRLDPQDEDYQLARAQLYRIMIRQTLEQ